jgi:hypothetical protein
MSNGETRRALTSLARRNAEVTLVAPMITLRFIIIAGLIAGSLHSISAQVPAAPRPAAPATPPPAPPTAQALDEIVQQALDAYNSGDFTKFFAVYDGPNVGKRDAKAFTEVVGEHGKNFGRYETRTMKPEWNDLISENPRVAYIAKFQKLPKANLSFRFKRTPTGFKIDELSILDSNVNN